GPRPNLPKCRSLLYRRARTCGSKRAQTGLLDRSLMNLFDHAARLIDDKPWAAHLYVTDQCNLDCHYCNEYDNSVPHPDKADLIRWMRKIRDLGVVRIGMQGGEPLMHPDIV